MEQYFAKDYTGAPFVLFDTPHLIALGAIVSICLSFIYFRDRWNETDRKRIRYGIASFTLIAELSWHWWSLRYGTWTIQTNLPLHLCSVFIWASIIMMINKSYSIYEMAYFLGLGGAIQAVLTPDAGIYGFPHFRAFQTFADHSGIIIAVMYMTLVEGYRPAPQSFKRMLIWANVYMAAVFAINMLIGSNYMYLAHKPEFPSIIDMLAPWPWYLIELELIGFAIAGVLYIPFLINDWITGLRKPEPASP